MTTVLSIQAEEKRRKADLSRRYVELLRKSKLSAKETKELLSLAGELGYDAKLLKVHALVAAESDRLEKEGEELESLIATANAVQAELQTIKDEFNQKLLELHEKIDPKWNEALGRQRRVDEAMGKVNDNSLQRRRLDEAFPFISGQPDRPAADPLRIGLPKSLLDALAEVGIKLDPPKRTRL